MIRYTLAALVAAHVPALSLAATPTAVDTGIAATQCIEPENLSLRPCSSAQNVGQDGMRGRDADASTNADDDGLLGFSFTKICNSGELAGEGSCPADPRLGAGRDDWGCTRDSVSGIWWEIKTRSGMRGMSRRFTNYSREYDPVGQFGSATDATGYRDRVNAQGLCGASDWALDHSTRLQSVIHYGRTGPKARVDPTFLPNTLAEPYWNSSLNPSRADTAWTLDYGTGQIDNGDNRGTLHPVRLVRDKVITGPVPIRYTYSADGSEATDSTPTSAITWRRCVEGMLWDGSMCTGTPRIFTINEALAFAAAEADRTGLNWHVPNVKELGWSVRRERINPATEPKAFPQTPIGVQCSSTPDVRNPPETYVIDFAAGRVFTAERSMPCMLRLARDPDVALAAR